MLLEATACLLLRMWRQGSWLLRRCCCRGALILSQLPEWLLLEPRPHLPAMQTVNPVATFCYDLLDISGTKAGLKLLSCLHGEALAAWAADILGHS